MSQSRRFSPHTRRRRSGLSTVVSLVLAAAAAALWPARGAAESFLSIFEPHRVVALALTPDDLESLSNMPDLQLYATVHVLRPSHHASFVDVRAAAAAAGGVVRVPTLLPGGLRPFGYFVMSPSASTIAFHQPTPSSGDARERVEALPADIAGTTLRLDFGTLVTAMYGPIAPRGSRTIGVSSARGPGRVGVPRMPARAVGRVRGRDASASGSASIGVPLIVAQMAIPRLSSSGVSVQRIVNYELDRPGVSARTRAAFATLRDLSTTLPIPIPVDRAYAQPVLVDGLSGLGIGDETGLGAAVLWQKNGVLYAVAGARPAREVLAIANSLR